jgi:hypothetical protein
LKRNIHARAHEGAKDGTPVVFISIIGVEGKFNYMGMLPDFCRIGIKCMR